MVAGPHCGGGELGSATISSEERNDLCGYVNDSLALECLINGFYFFTLFDRVVNQKSLNEISELYYDHHHLCLPPSTTGYALNAILNSRIQNSLSQFKSEYQCLQKEEVLAECNLIMSDIPGCKAGIRFEQERNQASGLNLQVGQYLLLIKLPFLMHPKEVILKFKKPINNVSTFVQGISESWILPKRSLRKILSIAA